MWFDHRSCGTPGLSRASADQVLKIIFKAWKLLIVVFALGLCTDEWREGAPRQQLQLVSLLYNLSLVWPHFHLCSKVKLQGSYL